MSTTLNLAQKALHDKIESRIKTVEAKLTGLKARAESAKANTELKTIAGLLTTQHVISKKLQDLKTAGDGTIEQAKADVETRLKELEQSVHSIDAKLKSA